MKTTIVFLLFIVQIATSEAVILKDVPPKKDAQSHYLFYLHGRIIEDQGIHPKNAQYGYYEYEQILKTLESRGFVVISEPRPKGTDPVQYAGKVVNQIQNLITAGVPAGHISVIGASKGALIAMLASTELKNPKVKFVIMGSCNDSVLENFHPNLTGEVLSIYEASDDIGESCKGIFSKSSGLRKSYEKELRLGNHHGFLYRPYKEWVDPAVAWCLRSD